MSIVLRIASEPLARVHSDTPIVFIFNHHVRLVLLRHSGTTKDTRIIRNFGHRVSCVFGTAWSIGRWIIGAKGKLQYQIHPLSSENLTMHC
jgi:hypothetical protein